MDIFNNNPETGDDNGYYPINNNQWTFCNMTAFAAGYLISLVLVWKENGEELLYLILVLEMSVLLDGGRILTMVSTSVNHLVSMQVVIQPPFLLMGVIQECVEELEVTKRAHQMYLHLLLKV